MKKRRNFYLIIGILLLALNCLVWIGGTSVTDSSRNYRDDPAYMSGYYFGKSVFAIIGVVLLVIAWSIQRKIKRREKQELIDSFD
jgi:hypothetical protein